MLFDYLFLKVTTLPLKGERGGGPYFNPLSNHFTNAGTSSL